MHAANWESLQPPGYAAHGANDVRWRGQGHTQQTRDIEQMLLWCWASVVDAGPTSQQHLFDVRDIPRHGNKNWQVNATLGIRLRLYEYLHIAYSYSWPYSTCRGASGKHKDPRLRKHVESTPLIKCWYNIGGAVVIMLMKYFLFCKNALTFFHSDSSRQLYGDKWIQPFMS